MKKLILALSLATASTAAFADYYCGGTEPFWGATIKSNKIIFTAPELERPVISSIDSRRTAAGVGPEYVFVVKSGKLTATVVTGADCTDGMSDNTYSHHIVLDRGNDQVLYGCCNKK